MRAFLAFDISKQVIDTLRQAQRELRDTGADVSLVANENLHFTVRFLGEVPDDLTHVVDQRISQLKLAAFEVIVKGLGVFPDLRRPRVVWVGVDAKDEVAISTTANQVIEALEDVGKPEDRGFRPHITIGRVRSPRKLEALISFVRDNSSREFGRTRVTTLKLKSSVLTPKGAVYSDVKEYALN
jgi:RNA 2',3'-cyclic 3'-phosphodiesterase